MTVYRILKYPHVLLRKVSKDVEVFSKDLQTFVDGMITTMRAADGIGLAAPQVGILRRVLVVDVSPYLDNPEVADWHGTHEMKVDGVVTPVSWPLCLVNPTFTSQEDPILFPNDGCLSFPGVDSGNTTRFKSIQLKARSVTGAQVEIQCAGIMAICLQHEIDHLNGVLFIDHLQEQKADKDIREEIEEWEHDPKEQKKVKKFKPVDAREQKFDFV